MLAAIVPIADIAQMVLNILRFFAQDGYCICDDVTDVRIPGIDGLAEIVDVAEPFPLTFAEQYALSEATANSLTRAP